MMFTTWLGFLLAAIVIAITPGPGAILSMSTGARHGYRGALAGILGLQAAILIHLAIVAVGFGALLAASETAFLLAKLMGAAYLVWLGIQKWRSPVIPVNECLLAAPRKGIFLQGLLVNLTNPKAIIFIGALVPQFIDHAKVVFTQYLLLAATLCLTDMIVMSIYALAAVRLGCWLKDPEKIRQQNRAVGGLFVTTGVLLAVSGRSS